MVENEKHSNYERRFLLWFAAAIVFFIMLYCSAVTFIDIPRENKDLANFALGALIGSGFTVIVGFFFGSSKSNKEKDDTIASMAQKGNNTPETTPTEHDGTNSPT